jgi:hypothetical protein
LNIEFAPHLLRRLRAFLQTTALEGEMHSDLTQLLMRAEEESLNLDGRSVVDRRKSFLGDETRIALRSVGRDRELVASCERPKRRLSLRVDLNTPGLTWVVGAAVEETGDTWQPRRYGYRVMPEISSEQFEWTFVTPAGEHRLRVERPSACPRKCRVSVVSVHAKDAVLPLLRGEKLVASRLGDERIDASYTTTTQGTALLHHAAVVGRFKPGDVFGAPLDAFRHAVGHPPLSGALEGRMPDPRLDALDMRPMNP